MSDTKSSNPKDILAANERRCLLHLIPSPGLIATALAMQDGAKKYGPYNWREEGVGATTYVSAALRHIRTWLDGEEDAKDSRVHHLGHAAACLMILLDAQAVGNLVDDRPVPAPTGLMLDHVKSGYHPTTEAYDGNRTWQSDEIDEPFDGSDLVHHMDVPVSEVPLDEMADHVFTISDEPVERITLQDYPFGTAISPSVAEAIDRDKALDEWREDSLAEVGGFADLIDRDPAGVKNETAKIEAIEVYESTWPMHRTGPVPPEPEPEEPHPDPLMAELGFKASDAEPGPNLDEPYEPSESFTDEELTPGPEGSYKRWLKYWGLVDPIPLVFGRPIFEAFGKTPFYGKSMADMIEEAQEGVIEEMEEQGLKNPRGFLKSMEVVERPVELGYKQVSRKAHFKSDVAGYHWTYDQACPCVRCEEETYRNQQKEAGSPNSEPTPNPNGGVA